MRKDKIIKRVFRHAEPQILFIAEFLPRPVDFFELVVFRGGFVVKLERGFVAGFQDFF
jgi:hypothetical protein